MSRQNKYALIFVLLISSLFTGCFGGSWKNTGLLTVEILDENPATVSRELFLREVDGKSPSILTPLGGSSRVSLSVPKGTWGLLVLSRERDGRVVAEGVEQKIRGGKSTYVSISLRPIYDAPKPPKITEVEWKWDPRGACIEWEIEGPTYPGDEWQIWRSRSDQNHWFKVGETFGSNLIFVDLKSDQGDFKYGVRFVDSRPGSFAGPLVVGHGPVLGGIKISWEFEHYSPSVSQRSLGLAMLPESSPEPEFTDLVAHFTSSSAFTERQRILGEVGLEIKREIPDLLAVLVEPTWNSELTLEEWGAYSGSDFFVEPNWIIQVENFEVTSPNSIPWYLSYARVPQAQSITAGSQSVRIAVLDTGLNSWEMPNSVNVLNGWNFVNDSHITRDDHSSNGSYHGTQMSKLIGEVIPFVSLQPVKVLNSMGIGNDFLLTEGLLYAVNRHPTRENPYPADIINMSLGIPDTRQQPQPTTLMKKRVELVARETNAIMFAASGNSVEGDTRGVFYPAALTDVIAVGAVTSDLGIPCRADYSHYGPELDLVAPPGSGEGTSFSTALVSGIAGLMLAEGISPWEVRTILHDTAIDLGAPGWDEQYGYGLVNAEWAVQQVDSFELLVSDYWTKELVWHKEVPLKGNPIFVSLPQGEYVVGGRLNNFYAESGMVQVQGGYGESVHLILREPRN
jgi:hypothetical protein